MMRWLVPWVLLAAGCISDSAHQDNLAQWDADGDGEYDITRGGTDCDDSNPDINAGAAESCNAIDDNCDGQTDEGFDPRDEVCDGVDNDCDGVVDESLSGWFADLDEDGYGDPDAEITDCAGQAGQPIVDNDGDCNDDDDTLSPDAAEICDSIDNDCSGVADDGGAGIVWYGDADGDGYGTADDTAVGCSPPEGYTGNTADCDDTNAAINPDAFEICGNTVDENCNGDTNDGVATYYEDSDADGYGNPDIPVAGDCSGPPSGAVTDNTDCNDNDELIKPGVQDSTCDGIDDDCDGVADEDGNLSWYLDIDLDGYGQAANVEHSCDKPDGYVAQEGDCDDTEAGVNPGQSEVCGDGLDNNCNGQVDEGSGITYYVDDDGDSYGDPNNVIIGGCTAPDGSVTNGDDCDDSNATTYPNADDNTCDGLDNDCDNEVDEDADLFDWYIDNDNDNYGQASAIPLQSCDSPGDNYVQNNGDCNDSVATINPDATEQECSGADENCDGIALGEEDLDADGNTRCNGDCDDTDTSVFAGEAYELQDWSQPRTWTINPTASLGPPAGAPRFIQLAAAVEEATGSTFRGGDIAADSWTLRATLAAHPSGTLGGPTDTGGMTLLVLDTTDSAVPPHDDLVFEGNSNPLGCEDIEGFCLHFTPTGGGNPYNLEIRDGTDSSVIASGQTVELGASTNAWHTLEMGVQDGRLKVRWDGSSAPIYDIAAPFKDGRATFGMVADAGADSVVENPRQYRVDATALFCGIPGIGGVDGVPPAP